MCDLQPKVEAHLQLINQLQRSLFHANLREIRMRSWQQSAFPGSPLERTDRRHEPVSPDCPIGAAILYAHDKPIRAQG